MGLLSNLRARLGTIGIDPNVSIPPKLTPSLPRGPAIKLPKIPRRPIGLPPRNISRIREDVGGIIERSLPVGEYHSSPTIQPDPMPAPMPTSPPVLGKPIMQQPLIGDTGPISNLDLRIRQMPSQLPVDPRIIPQRPPSHWHRWYKSKLFTIRKNAFTTQA